VNTEGWVMLHYRFPRGPTARRVYVWRKLKALGALLLQDAVWVLPGTSRTREQFLWLAAEITELGGDAFLWQAQLLVPHQAESLRNQFAAEVEREYEQVLAALAESDPDLRTLSDQYARARRHDYFQSALGEVVRDRLLRHRQEDG
jgi:hypothetical protein